MLRERLKRSLLIFLVTILVCTAHAQDLTGSWKGYIVKSDFSQFEQRYNIDIVFVHLQSNIVRCITNVYSKKSFQSRSEGLGIFNKKSNSLIFSETKYLQLASTSNAESCFFAFQLFYNKKGNETLTGIFRTRKDGSNYCSEGKVYLRKFIPKDEKVKIREERKVKRLIRKQRKKAIRDSK